MLGARAGLAQLVIKSRAMWLAAERLLAVALVRDVLTAAK